MLVTLISHIVHITRSPGFVYITFILEILNTITPLFYLFYSEDGAHTATSASTLFVSLVIATIFISYILCALFEKPVNETVDYLVFYAIIGVSIITKAYIVNYHLKIGKDNDLDHRINMTGVVVEALKLCLDVLLSHWLLAKFIKLTKSQSLGTAAEPSSRSTLTRVQELLFSSKKNN